MNTAHAGPLDGITVIDFTQMMAGPFATQILADMGANVIKVEKPITGEWERGLASMGSFIGGQSPFFLAMNRGKRSLAVDLKDERGKEIVRNLIRGADVVMSNFRPGAMERLGFGFDDVRAINPDVIYLASSGYGNTGPWVDRPGQDLLIQSVSGLVAQNGPSITNPIPVATSVMDAITALYNVIGVLSALLGRKNHVDVGEVHVSMLSAALAIQCQELVAHINLQQDFARSSSGLASPWNDAPYGIYETRDGYAAIAMADLRVLGDLLGLAELVEIAQSKNPFARRDDAKTLIEERTRTYNRDELIDLLLTKDVWCAPVLSFTETLQQDQVTGSGILRSLHHEHYGEFQGIGLPIAFSGFAPSYDVPPPMPGQDTLEILKIAGLSDDAIDQLIRDRIISAPEKLAVHDDQ